MTSPGDVTLASGPLALDDESWQAAGVSFYDDPEVLDAYLAHRHSAVLSPNLVMEGPAFGRAAGSLEGRRVLDLGCGDGTFARDCVDAGCASYVGIDSSLRMIDRARDGATSPNVRFACAAIEGFEADPRSFDLVAARMALHYVADISPVFERSSGALAVGGRLIFTVVHPVVSASQSVPDGPRRAQSVDKYFERGPREREWFGKPVTWHHRTVEDYVTAVHAAGLTLDTLSECAPDVTLFDGDTAEYERRQQVPLILLIAATKP